MGCAALEEEDHKNRQHLQQDMCKPVVPTLLKQPKLPQGESASGFHIHAHRFLLCYLYSDP